MSCTTTATSYDLPSVHPPWPYVPKIAVEKHTCCDIKSGDDLVYYATIYNLSDESITIKQTDITDTLVIKNADNSKTVTNTLTAEFEPAIPSGGLVIPAGESVNLKISFDTSDKYPLEGWNLVNTFAVTADTDGAYNGATSVHTSKVLPADCELLVSKQGQPFYVGDKKLNYNVTVFNPNKFDIKLDATTAFADTIKINDDTKSATFVNTPEPNGDTITAETSKTYFVAVTLTSAIIASGDVVSNEIIVKGDLQITPLDLS